MRWFVRATAVFVGLANAGTAFVLSALWDDAPGKFVDVPWIQVLLPVVAVVVAGLATSEIVLRWFGPANLLASRFARRYFFVVLAVCLGGVLMGFLLGYVITLNAVLSGPMSSVSGPVEVLEWMLRALGPGLVGVVLGLGLGLAEGLILAFPLAAMLGKFASGGQPRCP